MNNIYQSIFNMLSDWSGCGVLFHHKYYSELNSYEAFRNAGKSQMIPKKSNIFT